MNQSRLQNGARRGHKTTRNGVGKSGNPRREFERYMALARAAETAGDAVARESYYQHAEHYYRVMNGDGQPSAV